MKSFGRIIHHNLTQFNQLLTLVLLLLTSISLFSNFCLAAPQEGEIKKISLGYLHTCVIKTDSGLYCWGRNYYGQLGDETTSDKNTPPPSPVLTDVKEVSTGEHHTCAIKKDGSLYCWGKNTNGQLGDETTSDKNTPSPVLTEAKQVSLGEEHTCVVKTDGGLYCWGYNSNGQLGDGGTSSKNAPPIYPVLTEVKEVGLGDSHTCAIKTDGGLYCWGRNEYGQLGDETTTKKTIPAIKPVLTDVKMVSLGDSHTCAVKIDGGLYCWGRNDYGQLGDETTSDKNTPPPSPVLTDVKEVSAGEHHTCAIKKDGSLYCWGKNANGQLGDGKTTDKNTPDPVLAEARKVSLGMGHTCTVKTNGGLFCWGRNATGQLGDGTNTDRNTPQEIFSGGCTADTDGDSTPDCFDECATDPDKTEPGVCGCGKEEVPGCGVVACSSDPLYSEIGNGCDTGNLGECKVGVYICKDDAVACNQQKEASAEICGDNKDNDCDGEVDEDCVVDLCPEDPNKIEPGVCGCNIQDIDSDGDGVLDCLDGCPNDPKNKDLNPPEEGCFVENSEVPEKYDPKVEVDPEHIVTPKEKLLPVFVVKKKAKAVIYLERFSGATFKKLENLMALLQKANKKTTYRHEVRIVARNKKTGNRTTNIKKLRSNKTSFKLKLAKNTIYTIKYRIIIKQGKKEKATKWSKAVKVKK